MRSGRIAPLGLSYETFPQGPPGCGDLSPRRPIARIGDLPGRVGPGCGGLSLPGRAATLSVSCAGRPGRFIKDIMANHWRLRCGKQLKSIELLIPFGRSVKNTMCF